MDFIFEVILQLLGELLLQILLEALFELGIHSLREPFRNHRPINPWLAAIGYVIYGAIAGGISLWIAPKHFIASHTVRVFNLIATPVAAGFAMVALGAWRRRRDTELIRLDHFFYAFLFASSMSLVRFIFAH
jgi:hypothetical protein